MFRKFFVNCFVFVTVATSAFAQVRPTALFMRAPTQSEMVAWAKGAPCSIARASATSVAKELGLSTEDMAGAFARADHLRLRKAMPADLCRQAGVRNGQVFVTAPTASRNEARWADRQTGIGWRDDCGNVIAPVSPPEDAPMPMAVEHRHGYWRHTSHMELVCRSTVCSGSSGLVLGGFGGYQPLMVGYPPPASRGNSPAPVMSTGSVYNQSPTFLGGGGGRTRVIDRSSPPASGQGGHGFSGGGNSSGAGDHGFSGGGNSSGMGGRGYSH